MKHKLRAIHEATSALHIVIPGVILMLIADLILHLQGVW